MGIALTHSGPRTRAEPLSRALWAITVTAWFAIALRAVLKAGDAGEDSWFPMTRALDYLHGTSPGGVYENLFFLGHVKFQYPLSSLIWLDMLRHLGIDSVYQYNLINAGVFIATGLALAVLAVQILGSMTWLGIRLPVGPLAGLFTMVFYPERLGFKLGQMQLSLGLLFLLACLALWNNWRITAGCLIALAATVKPQFLPLGLLALWHKEWRFFGGLLAVTAVAAALSVALYGWDNQLHYLRVLSFLSRHGEYHHLNQSLNGLLVRFLYHGPSLDFDPEGLTYQSAFPPYIPAVYIATTISSLAMIAIPFLIRVKDDPVARLLSFCLAAALFTMASPIAWVHHYNILLPAFVLALRTIRDDRESSRRWPALAALGATVVWVGFPVLPSSEPTVPALNLLQSHVFIGSCVLVVLLTVELRRRSRAGAAGRVTFDDPATAGVR